jgi:hypothetical protein
MAMLAHELPPLQARQTWDSRKTDLKARRRIVEIAKEAGRFVLVIGIFSAIVLAIMALRVAFWIPALYR